MHPGHEPILRFGVFIVAILFCVLFEIRSPKRRLTFPRSVRWTSNLVLPAINTVVIRLMFPAAAVGAAAFCTERSWGFLNQAGFSTGIAIVISIFAIDLAIYFQHRLFHRVPWLWRVHRVHHSDVELDFTTGLRFHPVEILLSMGIKLTVIVILGPPALAVLLFEVILSTTSIFNHSNIRLPAWLDRLLRMVLVTPDMHHIHHSVNTDETNSNFGFNIPWWDRIFGTYKTTPREGQKNMRLGLHAFRSPHHQTLRKLLMQPIKR